MSAGALYSVFLKRVSSREGVREVAARYKKFGGPILVVEEVINNKTYYNIFLGKFRTKLAALNLSFTLAHHFKRGFEIKKIESEKTEEWKLPNMDVKVEEVANGPFKPAVPNRPDSRHGTPQNRRVEVEIISLRERKSSKTYSLEKLLKKGIYTLKLKYWNLYPLPLQKASLFIRLPSQAVVLAGSVKVNGHPIKYRRRGDLLILEIGKFDPKLNPLPISLRFFAASNFKLGKLPVYIIGQNPQTGKWIYRGDPSLASIARREFKRNLSRPTASTSMRREIIALKKKVKFGIISPDRNITTANNYIDLKIAVPLGSRYRLTQNGKPVSKKRIGERAKDKSLGIETIQFVAVPLEEGKNIFKLQIGKKSYTRKVVYTNKVADLRFELYPKNPPADGRTPVYVVVTCVDENGNVVPVSGFLKGWVNKGDIYDYATGRFRHYPNDQFTIKIVDGRATIKLSPSADTEERVVKVQFRDITKTYRFSFVAEKRPWLAEGILERKVAWVEDSRGRSGVEESGLARIYSTGTIANRYIVTLRYQSNPPQPSLQTPGEEGPGYPIYGDASRTYQTAHSSKRLYLKVEEGKSYFIYGDYSTGFGKGLKFEHYDRKFTGEKLDINHSHNYRLITFFTLTHRDVIRETIPANGLSGPYFWTYNMVPETEKVWIEVRDRENPDIILSKKEMTRFDDYEINYYQRYIIFRTPISEYDDNLNPVYIVIQYEGEDPTISKVVKGVRGEKWVTSNLKVGGEYVEERYYLGKKSLAGADFQYQKGRFKLRGEWAGSRADYDLEEPIRGTARAIQMEYRDRLHQFHLSYSYSQASQNFYNPTASIVNTAYRTSQLKMAKKWGGTSLTYTDKMDRNPDLVTRNRSLTLSQQIGKRLKVEGGVVKRAKKGEGEFYEVTNGKYGAVFRATNRLTIKYKREQTLKSTDHTSYRKTGRGIQYKFAQGVVLEVQNSKVVQNGTPSSNTLVSLKSKLPGHASAYAKYQVDDGVSGERAKGLIGINKVFKIDKKTALSTGYEQGKVYKGDSSENYKVVRLGLEWTYSKNQKISFKYETRMQRYKKQKRLLEGGIIWKAREGLTIMGKERFFISSFRSQDLSLSVAYRPTYNDRLNLLLKTRYTSSTKDAISQKWLLLLNLNYQPNRRWEITGQTGVRFQRVEGVGSSFVEMVRGGAFRFFGRRWRVGGYGGIIKERIRGSYQLELNPEVAYSPLPGFWLVGGVEWDRYFDNAFSGNSYSQRRYYFTIRFVFDEKVLKFWKRVLDGGFRQLFNPFWYYLDSDDFDDTFNDYY